MTTPDRRSRRWPVLLGTGLPLLLVTALLLPLAVLRAQAVRAADERATLAARERRGVEYLRSLGSVAFALIDAESAAVSGRPSGRAPLDEAVKEAASTDARLGRELRTTQRWTGLRKKIESLPDHGSTNPERIVAAYAEASDLLLALYHKVQDSSGLRRDPRPDSFHLQDGAAVRLPEALIATGRLANLAAVAAAAQSAQRPALLNQLAVLRAAALGSARALVEDLLTAVDSTESRSLGGNLLTELDSYQRAVQTFDNASKLSGPQADQVDPEGIAATRVAMQSAAERLVRILHTELDRLIVTRIHEERGDRIRTHVATAAAMLIILALTVTLLAGIRQRVVRRRFRPANVVDGGETAVEPNIRSNQWGRVDAAR